MVTHVINQGIMEKCKIDLIDSQLRADMEDAVNFAKTSSFPDGNMLMEHIYAS